MTSGIEYQQFSVFHDAVLALVAPEQLGESLETYFRDQVGNALCDIQTLIPATRGMNVSFVQKEDVNEFCAASSFQGPVGKISQLFAYKCFEDCKKFFYKRVKPEAVDCWVERQRCAMCNSTTPPSSHIYESPYCNYLIAGETACADPYIMPPEDDCRFRSLDDDDRIFTVGPDYKVHLAPRFPCGYVVCVQWHGIKRKWLDSDYVPVDQQFREAVVNYVEHKMALKERNRPAANDYFEAYTINLRMLKFRYHDEMDPEQKRDCTSALEQVLPTFRPLYETAVYGPCGVYSVPDEGEGISVREVYTGTTHVGLIPDDPNRAAIFYFLPSYQMAVWDPTDMQWH